MSNRAEFEEGSLILVVPSEDGIVICADKRIYSKSKGISDTFTKIIEIGDSSAFAVVGAPIVWHSDKKIFDVFEIIKASFPNQEIQDSEDTWMKIQNNLKSSFRASVLSMKYEDWPESQFIEENNLLFQIILLHNNKEKLPVISIIEFTYIKKPHPVIKTNIYPSCSAKGAFIMIGETEVIEELQTGNDKRFDKYRNNPKLKNFLTHSVQSEDVNISEARYFAKKMIKISSKSYSLITGSDSHISTNCDCAILHKELGFKWLK